MDVKQAKQLQQELERVKSLQDDITKDSARYNKEGKLGVKAQDELNKLLKREKELKENIANLQKKINDEKKKGNQEQKKESDLEKSIGKLLEGRVKKAKELATRILEEDFNVIESHIVLATIDERLGNLNKAKNVEEAKTIYETLQSAVGSTVKSTKTQPESLSEAISRPSTTLPRRKEEKKTPSPHSDRWKILAGLNNNN